MSCHVIVMEAYDAANSAPAEATSVTSGMANFVSGLIAATAPKRRRTNELYYASVDTTPRVQTTLSLARGFEAGTKMSTFAPRGHRGAPSHALGTNRHQSRFYRHFRGKFGHFSGNFG